MTHIALVLLHFVQKPELSPAELDAAESVGRLAAREAPEFERALKLIERCRQTSIYHSVLVSCLEELANPEQD